MAQPPITPPDVLVLAGGGTLGEAWMTGLLAGVEDAGGLDLARTESFVGTSAGAIVAARLASGAPLRRPRSIPPAGEAAPPTAAARAELVRSVSTSADPRARERIERAAGRLLAPAIRPALRLESLPGALVRSGVLAILPDGTRSLAELHQAIARDHGRFDGRLRIVGVDRRTGRRVVFGAPGAPDASVADAVAASCSIPGFFRPIEIAGREYVDGGVWSMTNLDAAPVGRRTELLCLNPMRGLPAAQLSRLGLIGLAVRAREALELAAVRSHGARVRLIWPAPPAARLMAPDVMDPGPREAVHHAAYAQGRALAGAA